MHQDQASISDLPLLVEGLSPQDREVFGRLFYFSQVIGYLNPPALMTDWVREHFGSLEAVQWQPIIKVVNRATLEGSLFNKLRAARPVSAKERLGALVQIIDDSIHIVEPLDDPLAKTPEDSFGRVRGKYCLTSANIAKYDGLHAMIIILKQHNPLSVHLGEFQDMVETAWRWLEKAQAADPQAKYPFFLWNCLWRAGATLIHTHAQVMLGQGQHYAKVEALRRAALAYQQQYGSNYFEDLYRVHRALGLGLERDGVRLICYLTPIKENEVLFLGPRVDHAFSRLIFEALACYRGSLKSVSFNLAIFTPPLAPTEESWEGFPAMARMVDRGDLTSRASDIGTMELYAQSVIASDPFRLARALKQACGLG